MKGFYWAEGDASHFYAKNIGQFISIIDCISHFYAKNRQFIEDVIKFSILKLFDVLMIINYMFRLIIFFLSSESK